LETLGENALDAEGNLQGAFANTKVGREYLAAQVRAANAFDLDTLETAVYNHLYTFFSRYYQDGDFISKRRYSKKHRYAIPYNGEEVTLYWANHDQYYVKSAEHFTDYTWKAPNGMTVHFKLQAADVEQNNVKGEKRFFLPRLDEIAWDDSSLPKGEGPGVRGQLIIPFEYRPLTEQETITYGKRKQQEAINTHAVAEIPRRVKAPDALAALTAERRKDAKGNPVSYLAHHLRQYTARNTRDFFIHKDLKGFLSRELDFYLKNEVLNLEEMEAAGEDLAEGWFQLLRLIKRVGNHIIEFLAQIENFQKMLWEKKKFVAETFYCITLGNIPEGFYPQIAENEAQWAEWRQLGMINPGDADVSSAADRNVGSSASSTEDQHKGWYSRGYLPHFDAGNVFQFITFRLHDSVPAEVIERWKQKLHWHEGIAADSKEAVELRKKIETYTDKGAGACYLRDERIARLVQDALKHFDGKRYRLIAWCVMPNHVHVLIETMDEPLAEIVQSWKSHTAHEANKLLGRKGRFWMPEYFDRYIRDEKHFKATVEYILQNPAKAGLVGAAEKWPWSGFTPTPGPTSVSDAGARDVREPRIAFLKAHPTLVLDTRHFPPDFTDRLLATFEDLDEMTDSLLVHSENWQALNLLGEKYRERVKTIYIDPPYNTDASAILYKNDYKNSSWITLMRDRLSISKSLLALDGILCVAIDDEEVSELRFLLDSIFAYQLGIAVVRSNPAGRKTKGKLAPAHEYALFHGKTEEVTPSYLDVSQKRLKRFPKQDEHGYYAWANFIRSGSHDRREDRPKLFYPIIVTADNRIRIPRIKWNEATRSYELLEQPRLGEEVVYPVVKTEGRIIEKNWQRGHERVRNELENYRVRRQQDGSISIDFKTYLDEESLPTTWWDDKKYASANYGALELKALFGEKPFDFSKSVKLVRDNVLTSGGRQKDAICLDYFAGSGTTGHAVINLNREDGGRRKFILVEMADYFDTVLLPRIKKVTFSPEWKDGKPKRLATSEEAERSPRIVKVIRLESYEDALNNITLDEASGQQALALFGDEYLLRYMLRWESKQSETLLDVEKLQSPFSYKLHLHRDGETRERPVDLPETFNYLIGLEVETRKVYDSGRGGRDVRYPREKPGDADVPSADTPSACQRYLVYRGATRDGRRVAVIWRETKGWTQADYERDAAFVAEQRITAGADEVYVNGDSYTPRACSLDGVFKARMFGQEG